MNLNGALDSQGKFILTKKFLFLFLIVSLFSCSSEDSRDEKYMVNCVKDMKDTWYDKKKPKSKQKPYSEFKAASSCQIFKSKFPDIFNYFKGKIATRKR